MNVPGVPAHKIKLLKRSGTASFAFADAVRSNCML